MFQVLLSPPFLRFLLGFIVGTMYKLIKKRRENASDRQTGSSYTNSRPSSPSRSCALPLERRSAHEEPEPATKSQLQPLISSLPALRNATIFPPRVNLVIKTVIPPVPSPPSGGGGGGTLGGVYVTSCELPSRLQTTLIGEAGTEPTARRRFTSGQKSVSPNSVCRP